MLDKKYNKIWKKKEYWKIFIELSSKNLYVMTFLNF